MPKCALPAPSAGAFADGYSLCEHVLASRLTAGYACGGSRFRIPINRVREWQVPPFPQPGRHSLCEHVLTSRPTSSGACGDNRFCYPINRV